MVGIDLEVPFKNAENRLHTSDNEKPEGEEQLF